MLTVDVRQVKTLSTNMAAGAAGAVARVLPLVRHHGQLLESRIKVLASTGYHAPGEPHIPGTGPGPNVATADYLRSIGPAETYIEGTTVASSVGSNAAQARRLEDGFMDMSDSLGRHFRQPAYPHFGPGLDRQAPLLAEDLLGIGFAL